MAVIHECPSCGKKLKIPDELVGKQVRCSDCAGTFVAEKPKPASPPSSRRTEREREPERDFDDERRPSRRSRDDRDGDLEPHRGGMVMAFGIISLVLVLLSGGVYAGGTAVALVGGVAGFPVTIIGIVLGILAWTWGGSDLDRMKRGYMDPSGQGNTQAGYICGIIGAVLNILALVGACILTIISLAIGAAFIGSFCCLASAVPPAPGPRPPPRPVRSISVPTETGLSRYLPDRFK